jgi:hypothetical protein
MDWRRRIEKGKGVYRASHIAWNSHPPCLLRIMASIAAIDKPYLGLLELAAAGQAESSRVNSPDLAADGTDRKICGQAGGDPSAARALAPSRKARTVTSAPGPGPRTGT